MQLKSPNRWIKRETRRWTSLLKRYRDEKLIDEEFEVMLSSISLEDLIALKLELSSKTLNSPLFGMPIWKSLDEIVKDAVIKFAISTTETTSEAACFLGINQKTLFKLVKKYAIWNYFDSHYLKKMKEKIRLKNEAKIRNMQNDTEH